MKRHDVSTHGPDTRYPADDRDVILWRPKGEWVVGWRHQLRGAWLDINGGTLCNIIAWSDPTEPESAEPVAWALISNLFGGPRPLTAYNKRQLAEDVAAAIDPSLQVVPLYATPPDTAPTVDHTSAAAWIREWTFDGDERGQDLHATEQECRRWVAVDGGVCSPLYKAIPDHTALLRQAVEALESVAERIAVIANLPMHEQDNMLSANMRTIARMADNDARAALAALRGAIGGV